MYQLHELHLSLIFLLLVAPNPATAALGLNAFSSRQVISGPGCPFTGGTCGSSGCQEASIVCTYANGTTGNSCCPYVPVPLLFCCDDPQPGGCCNVLAEAPGASVSPTVPTPGPSIPVVPDTTISSSLPILPGLTSTTTTIPTPDGGQGGGQGGGGGIASTSVSISSTTTLSTPPIGGGGGGGAGGSINPVPPTTPTVSVSPPGGGGGGGGAVTASIVITTTISRGSAGGGGGGNAAGTTATTTTSGSNGGGGAGGTSSNGTTPVQYQPGINLATPNMCWDWQSSALAMLCGTAVLVACT